MSMFKEIMGKAIALMGAFLALALLAASVGFIAGICFAVARMTFKYWS